MNTDSVDGAAGASDAAIIPLRDAARRARRPLPRRLRAPAGAASVHRLVTRSAPVAPTDTPAAVAPTAWERRTQDALAFLQRRMAGDYDVDDYGFDPDLAEHVVLPLLRPLYDSWFRVEVAGVEHIPHDGAALLVANHAGGLWPLDSAMTAMAVHVEHPARRYLRLLSADLMFGLPGAGAFARKSGATLACTADADRLLADGQLVGVWPEGFKGIGKPFRERYKLQRFGRGGFVHTALAAGAPIVPVSIVGSEEIHPMLANVRPLARLLGTPYFPLTPTFPWLGALGLVPLPSKWYIEFGAPIETASYGREAADDPATVFDLTDRVRETIQTTLYRLLVQRRSVWR